MLRNKRENDFLVSRIFKLLLLLSVLYKEKYIETDIINYKDHLHEFKEIVRKNSCNILIVHLLAIYIYCIMIIWKVVCIPYRGMMKIYRILSCGSLIYKERWEEGAGIIIEDYSMRIKNDISKNNWLQK